MSDTGNDMERKLRELLQGEADRVPSPREVPHQILRRARRRVAVTITGGFVVAAAIAVGSYTGVQALTGSRALQPGHTPSPSVSPTPSLQGPQPCNGVDLVVTADLNGAAGSRDGSIFFTNHS